MELIFATHNEGKVHEIQNIVGDNIKILSLTDIGYLEEIPETGSTFNENAFVKANTIYQIYRKPIFADDSGLEVRALNGRPGVYSARYAGVGLKNFEPHIVKLLNELNGVKDRKARFKSVICLIINDKTYYFEGLINGQIIDHPRGNNGFGYDPIFVPDGYTKTFAEMDLDEKNKISHRSQAIRKMIDFIMSEPQISE
ncbi:MAG TPA: RdgB/HAM1 family non-canonical purine NTP pyrophosphatase [Bacteroidales bacterium]|jgi:XTP/dITP diphosphohydrolase|nr:RdgB/HAM1 family non-canonical purine NTP pyrophosphatase [Bacteroidales bacterium]HOB27170.1 RdgB/HAM1 family non-canonical purine NTP pyrophosphatase [Bacteroidales bacterium]HOK21797.1 RdgB/HAM1 family non-canonical purine NTP pyrophosphatase [Bacteroidales bacterium]HOL74999.1 RdgB/HAM1 family non-canonical purine NTP pyrophosphatase [Bacteroidales bacterium]HPU47205.1 RdgB/HAM1 family non-canonical purine NTP pyrophosphatase [Bacteroidales bacterium]